MPENATLLHRSLSQLYNVHSYMYIRTYHGNANAHSYVLSAGNISQISDHFTQSNIRHYLTISHFCLLGLLLCLSNI